MLFRSTQGVTELIIAKQRNGPTGTVLLHFDANCTRFDNLSVGQEPDYTPAGDDVPIIGDELPSIPF